MEEIKEKERLNFFALFITDIFNEQSLVFTVGGFNDSVSNEFGVDFDENGYMVKGLLSRKKQFIPSVTKAIANALKEG